MDIEQRQRKLDVDISSNLSDWTTALAEAGLDLEIVTCGAVLDVLDELREATAAEALPDAEQAKSELEVLAEHYILKRSQAVMLKWAIEKYRARHQNPLLLRASELFSILTIGRYAALNIDADGVTPRLLGMRDDLRTIHERGHDRPAFPSPKLAENSMLQSWARWLTSDAEVQGMLLCDCVKAPSARFPNQGAQRLRLDASRPSHNVRLGH